VAIHPKLKEQFEADTSLYKLSTLRSLGDYFDDKTKEYMIKVILPTLMETDNSIIMKTIKDIANKFDIPQNLLS